MDRIRQHRTRYLVLGTRYLALLIACLAFTGCTTTGLLSKLTHKQKFLKASANNPAVRCLCLWEPAEGTGVDNKPARGVSGQIFFFTRNDASSVEVEGDVRVFLFDDHGAAEAQAQPLHQFDFLAGSWQKHVTSTQFGPAYQLFVPYSRKGHHQAELALRVRLTPPQGSPVYSDIAKVSLHGYDRSKLQDAGGAYEPESPHAAESADDSVSLSESITPQMIAQTFQQVRSEHRDEPQTTQSSDSRVRERPGLRRAFTPRNNESGGEFNVPKSPPKVAELGAADPPRRQHLRRAAVGVEEINSDQEN